jgi:glycosyltransferase involved in cell wall biosynthesis
VTDHLRRCQALILPGIEDFGMTAVEVQAAGRPVVARAGGGALETIVPGETGLLFSDPTPESLLAALRLCQEIAWDPDVLLGNSARFDRSRFLRGLDQIIAETSPALAGQLAPA